MESNKIIRIVYVATHSYCYYAKNFMESLPNFAPGMKKMVTILSDHLEDWDGYWNGDIISTNVIKMFDLYYPCINLHKPYFIEQLPAVGADYVFYFDADTLFQEVPDYDWESFFKELDEGKLAISKHPVYALKDGAELYKTKKENWISNFFTANLTEKDPNSSAYIGDSEYTYVISSFFGGTSETMHKICEEMMRITRYDLSRQRGYHIPLYMDENYFNALVYDYEHGVNDKFKFSVKQYSEVYGVDNDRYDTVFMYQKNLGDYKWNRQ